MTEDSLIIPFSAGIAPSGMAGLAQVGGKGANLLRMAEAGLPVPGGFIVSTRAYREYIRHNSLHVEIHAAAAALEKSGGEDIKLLEEVSQQITWRFLEGTMPEALERQLIDAYREIGSPAVAVRSSATAEDLPELSFAGQQDTFLNICGEDALPRAIVRCWASLWTARAIGYRIRNRVSNEGAALAVVVQQMIESEVSGVLFTANPLTGLRSETVIDAAFGLGEALVSGQVEPDHYVVRLPEREICSIALGAKSLSIHGKDGGGTVHVDEARHNLQALNKDQILGLAALGESVESLYGAPQDIEWGFADGRFYLLQSRPVTSLYPQIEGIAAHPLKVFMSFGAVQGMLDPMTPLGRYLICIIFAAGGKLYGYKLTPETQNVIFSSGERLWINLTTLLRNRIGRKIIKGALELVEPTVHQAILALWEDHELQPGQRTISRASLLRILRFFVPAVRHMIKNFVAPEQRRADIVARGEKYLQEIQDLSNQIAADPTTSVKEKIIRQVDVIPNFVDYYLPDMFLRFVSLVASGMASFNLLRVLANQLPESENGGINNGWSRLALEVVRGLPNNPTSEMDLALWEIAKEIRAAPDRNGSFQQDPQVLAEKYRAGKLPSGAQGRLTAFLERYGARGLAEIDAGRTRWLEDPGHIFEVLAGYLHIADDALAPDVAFLRGAAAAEEAVNTLANALRKQHHGRIKSRLLRFSARRVRAMMGARESPKFFAVRMMNVVRQELLRAGAALVEEGSLAMKDDLFFLTFPEIKAFAADVEGDWQGEIQRRRESYRRELERRQVPRLLLSDGRAIYEGMAGSTGSDAALTGSPVSPGCVEGKVRVVLDPRQANLRPGEIMVCPGTDPSWTPLFLTAAGLVMEVGGMMTHGAVVAREYGLPAVVGVDQATRRLATGQRVRVNGSTGMIDVLDDGAGE